MCQLKQKNNAYNVQAGFLKVAAALLALLESFSMTVNDSNDRL